MRLFRKRETVIQNIAYMAIMSAINIIFVLLSNLLPALLFLLVLILPLTSTVVTIYCKKKYYPIYVITTLGLCIAVAGGFAIFDALIYVIPSLVVGFLFGIGVENGISGILILVGATIVQFVLSYLTFFVLSKIVLEFNIMNGIISLFGLTNFKFNDIFVLVFVYIIAQIQIVLSYIFIKYEIKRLGIEINLYTSHRYVLYIITLISVLLAVLSYFYFPNWTIIFSIIPLTVYVYEVLEMVVKKSAILYLLLGLIHILFIFAFAFLFEYVSSPNQLILISVLTGSVTIIDFLNNYCFVKNYK